jgi:hypothetical protein
VSVREFVQFGVTPTLAAVWACSNNLLPPPLTTLQNNVSTFDLELYPNRLGASLTWSKSAPADIFGMIGAVFGVASFLWGIIVKSRDDYV